VALALSLPVNEYKPTILTITYAVVLFSIIVQGLTIKPLVERAVSKNIVVDTE
jgi:CPA1 family monovalent cation:H+ antiporter